MATAMEYREEIIKRYLSGETALDISRTIPLHNTTISRFLQKEGISRGRTSSKRVFEAKQKIIEDFKTGKYYCEDLAKRYNVDICTVYRTLDKAGLTRKRGYHSNCNEHYFEQIDTPGKAYALGFITADGAVVNNYLAIEVHQKDADVLDFFRKEINPVATKTIVKNKVDQVASSGERYVYEKDNVRVAFSAKQLGIDLAKYGVVQNKSKIITGIPECIVDSPYLSFYFRGLFDGDGCIKENGEICLYSGSRKFLENVQDVLVSKINVSRLKIYHGTSYFLSWNRKSDRQKFFDFLYGNLDKAYFYPRKYDRLKNSL